MRRLLLTILTGVISFVSYGQSIRLNQIGYYPSAEKIGVLNDGKEGDRFQVINEANETILEGRVGEPRFWNLSGEEVSILDFSGLKTPGTYHLSYNGENSHSFQIANNWDDPVLLGLLKAFYYQRASTELTEEFAGDYARALGHPDNEVIIHPSAASATRPVNSTISSPKGWYDAGDYNKYIVNAGISTYSILATYEHYATLLDDLSSDIPESSNNVADILDEAMWELEWMLTMQDPADGGIYHKLTHKNFTGYITPQTASEIDRFVVSKSTAATLDFAAVMAMASRLFQPLQNEFPGMSNTFLRAAEDAWKWAKSNSSELYQQPADILTGEYGDGNVNDEFQWAAAELYITTGNNSYYNDINLRSINASVPSWQSVSTLALISLARNQERLTEIAQNDLVRNKIITLANRLRSGYDLNSPYRITMTERDYIWGSNSVAANQAMILLNAFELTGEGTYLAAGNASIDYLLGKNPLGFSFVTGFGDQTPMDPHHRPSLSDRNTLPVPGLLAGGPHSLQPEGNCNYPSTLPAISYVDDVCSFSTNEIAINWNAAMVYATAGLQYYMRGLGNIKSFVLKNPKDLVALEGGIARFDIVTVGEGFTYQWFLNDEIIEGAIESSYIIEDVTLEDDSTFYSVRVTLNGETSTTAQARLNVMRDEVIDVITSTNENLDLSLQVYPNPTLNKIINLTSVELVKSLNVYDMSGKSVASIEQPNELIDLSGINAGLYLLSFRTLNNQLITKRLILK